LNNKLKGKLGKKMTKKLYIKEGGGGGGGWISSFMHNVTLENFRLD
jgi:hypothetical protein